MSCCSSFTRAVVTGCAGVQHIFSPLWWFKVLGLNQVQETNKKTGSEQVVDFKSTNLNVTPRGRSDLVVGHLQQVQHDFMSPHVLQQPLLLLPHSCAAHLVEPLQNLQTWRCPESESWWISITRAEYSHCLLVCECTVGGRQSDPSWISMNRNVQVIKVETSAWCFCLLVSSVISYFWHDDDHGLILILVIKKNDFCRKKLHLFKTDYLWLSCFIGLNICVILSLLGMLSSIK